MQPQGFISFETHIGSRDVFDNSCAIGMTGFSSFKITTAEGSNKQISAFSRNTRVSTVTSCINEWQE